MWYLDYHGFEAMMSTGSSGMRTSNMARVHTGCLLTSQDIPPSCSSKPLQSWTFFRHFHPVAGKRVRLEALHHMPKNALTYTCRHTSRMVLACSMSPKQNMVSPMKSAATWGSNTFRCRNSKGGSVKLISPTIKCFCAVPQPAVPVDQMYKMQASSDDDRLYPVRCKLAI